MSRYQPVMWSEGMFLAPQHFQEAERAQDAWQWERARQLTTFAWGLRELDIDADSLAAGRIVITRAVGILPDGTPVRAPEYDELPEGRVIGGHLAGGAPHLDVLLALPEYRAGSPNLSTASEAGARPTRFLERAVHRTDLLTGTNERELRVGVRNIQLLFGDESNDGYTTVLASRLIRDASGRYSLVEEFAPPSISIGSSDYLIRIMQRVVEMLAARSTALAVTRRQKGAGAMEFGVTDINTFWLLHTVNSALPGLVHALGSRAHPEFCYLQLARLGGELLTFMPSGHPSELPTYQHDNPAASLGKLEALIRQGLEVVLPSNYTVIPLEKSREYVWTGRMRDDRMIDGAKVYLAVGGDVPETNIGTVLPTKVKIGSPNTIDGLIGAALRGVAASHMTWVPSAIPARAGYHYFQLDTNSELWNEIRLAKTIAVYLPSEYAGAKADIYAVRD